MSSSRDHAPNTCAATLKGAAPDADERPCPSGKIAYATRAEASKARAGFISRNGPKSDPLSIFCCGRCGDFHLGRSILQGRTAQPKRKPHERADVIAKRDRWRELAE